MAAKISQSTDHTNTETKAGFRTVSSHLNTTDAANEARSQKILSRFDDQAQGNTANLQALREAAMEQRTAFAMTETVLGRVNKGFTSNSRELEITRKEINNLYQMLRPRALRQNLTWRPNSAITHIFGISASHWLCLPFGQMLVRRTSTSSCKDSHHSPSDESIASESVITFVPPM